MKVNIRKMPQRMRQRTYPLKKRPVTDKSVGEERMTDPIENCRGEGSTDTIEQETEENEDKGGERKDVETVSG